MATTRKKSVAKKAPARKATKLTNIKSNTIEEIANKIVESFKLEPLEYDPEVESVEFDTPGIEGSFGDGADAKGDGIV